MAFCTIAASKSYSDDHVIEHTLTPCVRFFLALAPKSMLEQPVTDGSGRAFCTIAASSSYSDDHVYLHTLTSCVRALLGLCPRPSGQPLAVVSAALRLFALVQKSTLEQPVRDCLGNNQRINCIGLLELASNE
jgi:hypothetical protein